LQHQGRGHKKEDSPQLESPRAASWSPSPCRLRYREVGTKAHMKGAQPLELLPLTSNPREMRYTMICIRQPHGRATSLDSHSSMPARCPRRHRHVSLIGTRCIGQMCASWTQKRSNGWEYPHYHLAGSQKHRVVAATG
jgi:hypothetical protein